MMKRQPAKRLFITEILNTHEQLEKDGVKFAVTPLGDEVSRVFLVATLLECEENGKILKLRVADQTGGMSIWISDRTPELMQKAAELASDYGLVAIVGKIRVVSESFTTIRVEKIGKADEDTKRLWLKEALKRAKSLLDSAKDVKDENFAERLRNIIAYIESELKY